MTDTEKDDDMICGLTADEHRVLRRGLEALPDTMPPRVVWHRIREQAEAEGLLKLRRRYGTWLLGAGLAAAVTGILVVPGLRDAAEPSFSPTPDAAVAARSRIDVLDSLKIRSAQLEDDLRALPAEPRVVRAGIQATILELEDRIAAIDYQLSDPEVDMTADEQEIFWRERVRLMESLVRLRYAQAQRTAF